MARQGLAVPHSEVAKQLPCCPYRQRRNPWLSLFLLTNELTAFGATALDHAVEMHHLFSHSFKLECQEAR